MTRRALLQARAVVPRPGAPPAPGGGQAHLHLAAGRPWLARAGRAAAALLLASAWLVASGPGAGAHALLRSSDPPDGAVLATAPKAVAITFTEAPEPSLSTVRVLDANGRTVQQGKAEPVVGDPLQLRLPLGPLPDGTYTVAWRTVSKSDGHVTGGAFAFGVGAAGTAPVPKAVATAQGGTTPSPLATSSRLALYWGLAVLLGATATGLVAFGGRLPGDARWLLAAALGVAALGAAGLLVAEARDVGVPLGRLLDTGSGRALARQALAVALTAVPVALLVAKPRNAALLGLVAGTAAGAMLAHALTGHAAAESHIRLLNLAVQWAHLLAIGVWIGGLVWLLVGIGHAPPAGAADGSPLEADAAAEPGREAAGPARRDTSAGAAGHDTSAAGAAGRVAVPVVAAATPPPAAPAGQGDHEDQGGAVPAREAVARYSRMAGWALAVVIASGAGRALAEIGGWHQLTSTSFGHTLLVKSALVTALVALGATNRYRVVPAIAAGLERFGRLRRNVRIELLVAVPVLLAAALLSELPPAAYVTTGGGRPPAPASVTVTGNDFGTSVRVTLEVTPGRAGPNRFDATVTDYDSHQPVAASRVQLGFAFPARPEVSGTTLELAKARTAGEWTGQGSQLSLQGRWDVTVLVGAPTGAVTVPLQLDTAGVTPTVTPQGGTPQPTLPLVPGQPVVYQLQLGGGRTLQAYLDPGHPGVNQVHLTFFDPAGNELAVASAALVATPPQSAAKPLALTRFSSGHFVANATLAAGRWSFAVSATAKDGTHLAGSFTEPVK